MPLPVTPGRNSTTTHRIVGCLDAVIYCPYSDHLGSTSVLSDATGTKVEGSAVVYAPFGEVRAGELMYNGARYYLPSLRRFISADTLVPSSSQPQTLNRYSYVINNPLVFVDPTGHVFRPGPMIDGYFSVSYIHSGGNTRSVNYSYQRDPVAEQQIAQTIANQHRSASGESGTPSPVSNNTPNSQQRSNSSASSRPEPNVVQGPPISCQYASRNSVCVEDGRHSAVLDIADSHSAAALTWTPVPLRGVRFDVTARTPIIPVDISVQYLCLNNECDLFVTPGYETGKFEFSIGPVFGYGFEELSQVEGLSAGVNVNTGLWGGEIELSTAVDLEEVKREGNIFRGITDEPTMLFLRVGTSPPSIGITGSWTFRWPF